MADNDFGFVMVGGDLLFGAFYAASDRLTLTGNLLYADFDNSDAGTLDSAIEISGVAGYPFLIRQA